METDIEEYYSIWLKGEEGSQGGYLAAWRDERKNGFSLFPFPLQIAYPNNVRKP